MAKKKRSKQPQQNSFKHDSDDDQSDSKCTHLCRALNQTALKKTLKSNSDLFTCQSCGRLPSAGGVWLCLQCGHVGCGAEAPAYHSIHHYRTPRSDCHALAAHLSSWLVWCYICEKEVSLQSSVRLKDLVSFLKKNAVLCPPSAQQEPTLTNGIDSPPPPTSTNSPPPPTKNSTATPIKNSTATPIKNSTAPPTKNSTAPPKPRVEPHVPFTHVKGLENLGNTCFFNSVVQCLNQTQLLHELLASHTTPPFTWSFKRNLAPPSHGDGSQIEDIYSITLEGPRSLTQSLANFLQQMRASLPKKGHQTLSPNQLFGEIIKKCSQFKDYSQQDSHELLRTLLDSIRTEQMKRQKNGLLHCFKMFKSINPKEELTNKMLKALSRQACHTLVDRIFGGHIISTVLCQECHYSSQLLESFLDISLPLFDEPSRQASKEAYVKSKDAPVQRSKHQLKKAKKMHRREQRVAKWNGSNQVPGKATNHESIAAKDSEEAQKGEEVPLTENNEEIVQNGEVIENEELKDEEVKENGKANEHGDDGTEGEMKADEELQENCTLKDEEIMENGVTIEDNEEIKEADIEEEDGLIIENCDMEGNENMKVDEEPLVNGEIKDEMADELEEDQNQPNEEGGGLENAPCEEIQDLCHKIQGMSIRNAEKCNLVLKELEAEVGSTIPPVSPEEECSDFQKDFVYKCMTTLSPHPDPPPGCSVISCLRKFTAPEHMSGENKFLCDRCTKTKGQRKADGGIKSVYTNATLQVLILNCPPVLTLHLKRFHQEGYSLGKVEKFVAFPLILDMAPYTSSIAVHLPHMDSVKSKILYSLYGVVEHQGRLNRGHFTAYVRSSTVPQPQQFVMRMPLDLDILKSHLLQQTTTTIPELRDPTTQHSSGRWYHISDTSVREVTEAQVLRCQAYLLFYQRIL